MAREDVPEDEKRTENGDIGSTRDVGMSKGITFTERHDQNMAGSDGKCGPESLGDIEAK
jgi:hypothetical protein